MNTVELNAVEISSIIIVSVTITWFFVSGYYQQSIDSLKSANDMLARKLTKAEFDKSRLQAQLMQAKQVREDFDKESV